MGKIAENIIFAILLIAMYFVLYFAITKGRVWLSIWFGLTTTYGTWGAFHMIKDYIIKTKDE